MARAKVKEEVKEEEEKGQVAEVEQSEEQAEVHESELKAIAELKAAKDAEQEALKEAEESNEKNSQIIRDHLLTIERAPSNFVIPDEWQPPLDTAHKIIAGEDTLVPDVNKQGVDQRYATPALAQKPTVEPAATSNDWQQEFLGQIQGLVAAEVAKLQVSVGTVPVEMTSPPPVAPLSFKKHYRCDAAPELVIQQLDMSALDRDERPQANPLPGEYIKFRMGHLYTSDDGVIAQIEWMKNRPTYTPDMQGTLGGNPSIYEDDGADVYRCTQGCDFVTASKNSWEAHMWGTHQVQAKLPR
jgi:hypothetical protein